jgi:hypothetical protein
MPENSLKNSIENCNEKRIIAIGSNDIDAVERKGEGVIVYDTHNFDNIGLKVQYDMKEMIKQIA